MSPSLWSCSAQRLVDVCDSSFISSTHLPIPAQWQPVVMVIITLIILVITTCRYRVSVPLFLKIKPSRKTPIIIRTDTKQVKFEQEMKSTPRKMSSTCFAKILLAESKVCGATWLPWRPESGFVNWEFVHGQQFVNFKKFCFYSIFCLYVNFVIVFIF